MSMTKEAMRLEYNEFQQKISDQLDKVKTAMNHENVSVADLMELAEVAKMLGNAFQRLANLKEYLDKEE
jgi:hypothetical protein